MHELAIKNDKILTGFCYFIFFFLSLFHFCLVWLNKIQEIESQPADGNPWPGPRRESVVVKPVSVIFQSCSHGEQSNKETTD